MGTKIQGSLTASARTAFYEADIILTRERAPPEQDFRSARWINAAECIALGIKIQSEYPTSSYLFQCLLSPGGDPISSKVAVVSHIRPSATPKAISRLFLDLSKALKDINATKAAQLLRPLHDRPIFPVTDGLGKCKHDGFDRLLSLQDTSWYIADQSELRESFVGKIPLLALPVEDIRAVHNLFTALRLEDRNLSKRSRCQTQPRGRVALHWPSTTFFAGRAPFIKA